MTRKEATERIQHFLDCHDRARDRYLEGKYSNMPDYATAIYNDLIWPEEEKKEKAIKMINHHIVAIGGSNNGSLLSAIRILRNYEEAR